MNKDTESVEVNRRKLRFEDRRVNQTANASLRLLILIREVIEHARGASLNVHVAIVTAVVVNCTLTIAVAEAVTVADVVAAAFAAAVVAALIQVTRGAMLREERPRTTERT